MRHKLQNTCKKRNAIDSVGLQASVTVVKGIERVPGLQEHDRTFFHKLLFPKKNKGFRLNNKQERYITT